MGTCPVQVGVDLQHVGVQASRTMSQEGPAARDEVIRDVLGLKSPQTAVKRANALMRVFR